ncbi:mannitol dehydrogenase domain protein [Sphingobacterium spiritivorum ATCC 33300]|uniref:Mannitol dehydrogenase domain protein n=1 Tax=Sphingobacterium spiritivorum ATCC 33300 TaxID=525372 RepID=C2FSN7_SPHSI|nr:tagaturonate reductase [Sphingobacterium spiritivorum]EEI94011.1 mannitol dehydrogenase domain protein [Sphingobacterium spiritivorum ATCC 33300]QQS94304.1 tagaturonate reductase [Sphingobacterium spiritivorum]
MILNRKNLEHIQHTGLVKPAADLLDLPEKILQFGTGVLLRGLPDYFIDKANRQGIFNGRILVVKSTSQGGVDAFSTQDGLYTVAIRGIEEGKKIHENIINSSISRVLSAANDWKEILKAAHRPEMQVVFSNTTEVGIVMSEDKVTDMPPSSYPGKLLAFLYERFSAFGGTPESGMVIVPAELISDNATKLQQIVFDLAEQNNLDKQFITWLKENNHFCNTLVDRIVPGKLPQDEQNILEQQLGYTDELTIMAEPFRLWAIESEDSRVAEILSFAQADKGIFIVPSISKFKELKLRLLNGTHTLSCALAILAGFETVREAMKNEAFTAYVKGLMEDEISAAILSDSISREDTASFANSVIDRFSNPSLEHKWQSIAMNYTSKMEMRNRELFEKWYQKFEHVPQHMALGFAAYLLFMNSKSTSDGYCSTVGEKKYILQDEHAPLLAGYWNDPETLVEKVLADQSLWGTDLNSLPGFATSVKKQLNTLQNSGAKSAIESLQAEKTI